MTLASTGTLIEVETRAGRVRGAWRGTPSEGGASAAFLGIPFAEPPVGDLRFAAPMPKRPWEGTLDALEYAPTAQRGDPGVTLIPEPSIPGDSTLNVNVFTPAPGTTTALPVLVYIHGGGYFAGSPASPWYDGAAFNRDGVVTVSISYRLGFDGFGWIEDAPLNRGVLDWMLALEWVRDNIAAFGGDPARVTIAGQSAGGGAVLTLLGMPAAQPLFEAVYCISGAAADVSVDEAQAFGRRLAEAGGVTPDRAGLSSLSEERVLELQKQLTAPAEGGNPLDGLRQFVDGGLTLGPVIDGDLVPLKTVDAIRVRHRGGQAPRPRRDRRRVLDDPQRREGQAPLDPVALPARQGRTHRQGSLGLRRGEPRGREEGDGRDRRPLPHRPDVPHRSRCASSTPEAKPPPGSTGSRGRRRRSAWPCTASTCRSSSTASRPTRSTPSPATTRRSPSPTPCTREP